MPCVEDVIISNELHKARGVKKAFANKQLYKYN